MLEGTSEDFQGPCESWSLRKQEVVCLSLGWCLSLFSAAVIDTMTRLGEERDYFSLKCIVHPEWESEQELGGSN